MNLGPKNHAEEFIFAEEEFRVHVQYTIQKLLNDKKGTRSQLASALGVTEARVSQIFSSQCNLTLRMLGKIFHVLGEKAQLECGSGATKSQARPWQKQWEALEQRSKGASSASCGNSDVYEKKSVQATPLKSAAKVA
jgi:transcriptional regulator with XRE-family HTH domain